MLYNGKWFAFTWVDIPLFMVLMYIYSTSNITGWGWFMLCLCVWLGKQSGRIVGWFNTPEKITNINIHVDKIEENG